MSERDDIEADILSGTLGPEELREALSELDEIPLPEEQWGAEHIPAENIPF